MTYNALINKLLGTGVPLGQGFPGWLVNHLQLLWK